VSPEARVVGEQQIAEGLIAPLILRFASPQPVYPMALTGTVGRDTQVLLYVYSDHRLDGDGRVELHAAVESHANVAAFVETDPHGFFTEREKELGFITEFKGILTPEQMHDDLRFTVASEDESYHERVVRF
jgi:hypothetical protein